MPAAAYETEQRKERDYTEQRKEILRRLGQLETERSSWIPHWQDLTDHLLPRNGRYFQQDRNRTGRDRYNRILDNTGTHAVRVLAAGMMAGATSPARPWFRLATKDPDLNRYQPVREWLDDAVSRMQRVFQASNTYRTLHGIYEELAVFGTGVSIVLPDFENVIHHYPVTTGEYMLAQDWQSRITVLYRRFERTAIEVVKEFGIENVSPRLRDLVKQNGSLEAPVQIIHVIEPREDRDLYRADAANMPWKSCYLEVGAPDEQGYLRESGFVRFPVLAPRWGVAGGDVYGHSPGMEALGDVRQLQHEQLRKGQGIDKGINPPVQIPTHLANLDREALPGGVSWYDPGGVAPYDQSTQHGGIRNSYETRFELQHMTLDIQDVRHRIERSFFSDLFRMFADAGTQTRMTATEVAERHEEKLLMLGPVLERLHNELLEPLIDMTFDRMLEVGALLPPPPELEGQSLGVEFVSILAQAQRAIGTNSIDRYVAQSLLIAKGGKPEVLDKFNADKWADRYSDSLGVPADLIVGDDQVKALRDARNQAQAAAAQTELMAQQAKTARDMASAPTGGGQQTVLTDLMDQLTGYSTPSTAR